MTNEPVVDAHDWALTEEVPEIASIIIVEEIDTTNPWYKGKEWAHYHQTGKVYTFEPRY